MKKFLLLIYFVCSVAMFGQVADHVVIAEIYAAGGNSGAVYSNDYVVLYNPTGTSVDLSSWSVQYNTATSSGTAFTVLDLSNTISANSYYLIKLGSQSATGAELPSTPDITYNLNISASGGKIALVNDQTAITNKSDSNVIDFVGYGSTANEYEGAGYAVYPSNTSRSLCRKDNNGLNTYGSNGNGYDTDNNNTHFFSNVAPSPLPVELTSFTSNVSGNKVNLYWETATEVNNHGFQVQRNVIDGQQSAWETIGFVQGSGNSNSPKSYSFTDEPKGGKEFQYRLKQIDLDGRYEYSETISALLENVSQFVLDQNFPNPFNPTTKISYTLSQRASVRLKVYDMLAKEIAELVDAFQEAGRYEVTFDGSSLSSGTYFYKLEAGSFIEVKKFILIK